MSWHERKGVIEWIRDKAILKKTIKVELFQQYLLLEKTIFCLQKYMCSSYQSRKISCYTFARPFYVVTSFIILEKGTPIVNSGLANKLVLNTQKKSRSMI